MYKMIPGECSAHWGLPPNSHPWCIAEALAEHRVLSSDKDSIQPPILDMIVFQANGFGCRIDCVLIAFSKLFAYSRAAKARPAAPMM